MQLAPAESPTTAFTSKAACITYAAEGGTIVTLVTGSLRLSMSPTGAEGFWFITANLADFPPNTTVQVGLTLHYVSGIDPVQSYFNVWTDAEGNATENLGSYQLSLYNCIELTAGGLTSSTSNC